MLRRTLLIATIVVFASTIARASTPPDKDVVEAREHYKRGTSAFELGSYEEAIREYAAAYRLRDDPALLYNLGQANRLGNHPAEALRFFRLFLMKVPGAQNRVEVESKIAELQKLIDQQKKTQNMPPDSVAPPSTPETRSATRAAPTEAVPKPPVMTRLAIDSQMDRAGRTQQIAGGVVAGVGVLLVGGGIVCGVLAMQASDRLTQLNQSKQNFDYSQQQLGVTAQVLEGVFIGVGAAAVVAGGAVLLVGRSERAHARHVAVVPALDAHSATLTVVGTF